MPVSLGPIVAANVPRPDDHDRLAGVLSRLYAEQVALTPDADYLREHARPPVVRSQVAAFRWYRHFLPPGGTILDWGCNHSPDGCLLRAWAGERYELHACDFGEPDRFAAFHDFAAPRYTRLTHLYQLPFGDAQYDAVIASGVLEHAAMDYESLKELHRVLKLGGVLIITYLPNRWSSEEWRLRVARKTGFHRRLYGLDEARRLLLHTGFDVIEGRNQAFDPRRPGLRGVVGAAVRAVVPLHWFSGTLCFAARKVTMM